MTQAQELRLSPIAGLSVELLRMILEALPDVASLQAAVLSCPLFYRAFLEAETSITTHVLLHQIDISVLPEAIAAAKSSRLNPHGTDVKTRRVISEFVAQNLHQRPTPPRSWSLWDALRLAQFHSRVDWFSVKFARAALTKHPLDSTPPVATHQETCRIERALYRFETYCNLFREYQKTPSTIYEDQEQLFFANFAPWENEQLGCVHDSLARAVLPAFNDIAEHDVAWGAFHVEYGDNIESPFIQHVLSLGVEKLYHIARAKTYEEKYDLLYSPDHPPATDSFLMEGLRRANGQNDEVFLGNLAEEDEMLHVKKPCFADVDSGPEDIWRWAHQGESPASWIYQKNRQRLREWGYVMWDRSRLEAIGIMKEPWEDIPGPGGSLLEDQDAARERAYMENSWKKREQIHMSGGTGWWSWGDQSRVKWRGRAPPREESTGYVCTCQA